MVQNPEPNFQETLKHVSKFRFVQTSRVFHAKKVCYRADIYEFAPCVFCFSIEMMIHRLRRHCHEPLGDGVSLTIKTVTRVINQCKPCSWKNDKIILTHNKGDLNDFEQLQADELALHGMQSVKTGNY